MPVKKINPNRMELMKLKKRLKLAVRGHKLMKDKFDELLKEFFEIAKMAYKKRKKLEKMLMENYNLWAKAYAAHEQGLVSVLASRLKRSLMVKRIASKRVGTEYISFKVEFKDEGRLCNYLDWDENISEVLERTPSLVAELVELAGIEQTLKNLAEEMEKTRRRVNALEQILIPQIESQIKQVQGKLDELEREARTRTAKVKEMTGIKSG